MPTPKENCAQCGRSVYAAGTPCPYCRTFWTAGPTFCSRNCMTKHVGNAHSEQVEAEAEQDRERRREKARNEAADELEATADELRGRRPLRLRDAILGLLVLGALSVGCCIGLPTWLATKEAAAARELKAADALYAEGKKAEATTKYKEHFDKAPDSDKPLALKRIVEQEVDAGHADEARRWVERGLDQRVAAAYEAPAARALLASVQAERDAKEQARRAEQEAQRLALEQKARSDLERRVRRAVADLKAADARTRQAAAALLLEQGAKAAEVEPAVERRLGEALSDADVTVRQRAYDALVKVGGGPAAAVPGLSEAIQGRDLGVRTHALALLKGTGQAAAPAAPALVGCLGEPKLRAEATEVLALIGKPAVPELVKAVESGEPAARQGAVQALGRLGAEAADAVPALVGLFRDDALRQDAVLALGKVGRPAVGELTKALDEVNEDARKAAVTTLGHIGAPAQAALPRLTEVAKGDASTKVREAATLAVSRIRRGS